MTTEIVKRSWWSLDKGARVLWKGEEFRLKAVSADEVLLENDDRRIRMAVPSKKAKVIVEVRTKSPWDKPETDGERIVAEVLGGKLVSIDKDGETVMPIPDETTLSAHLLIFHGIIVGAKPHAEQVAAHDADHKSGTVKVPHVHRKHRP